MDPTSIELLKLQFVRSPAGTWSIDVMHSISLRPAPGAEQSDFFVIDDHLVHRSLSFGLATYFLRQSIVPIVAHVQGENVLRCLGTGFFVSCSGLLVTAAHVITAPIEERYGGMREVDGMTWSAEDLNLGVMIPVDPLAPEAAHIFRPIEWATFLARRAESPLPIAGVDLKLTSDTAICKVAPIGTDVPHQPLAMVQAGLAGVGMAVGKTAIAVGYGALQDVQLTAEAPNRFGGDFSFVLHAASGAIIEHFADNTTQRRVPTPGACFSASLRLPAGMSGSPIFDNEGVYVHGVVSRGWENEQGVEAFGFGSMLAESWHVPIKPLGGRTLATVHADEEHGFPKLSGPGM